MRKYRTPRRSTARARSARAAATLTLTAGLLGLAAWQPGGSAGAAAQTTTSTSGDPASTTSTTATSTSGGSTTTTSIVPITTTSQGVSGEGTGTTTPVVERRTEIGEAEVADAAVAESAVTLPSTGSDLGGEAMLGFGFVAAGALLLIRRRRSWARP
jgi:LPXTG-motif cell wall-anchored protein